jgi:ABC-2 type transport system permease protein
MRWLLVKDAQILKRSPLLVAMLIVYPVALALMIGIALSSPPGKPKVAVFSEVTRQSGRIHFGSRRINVTDYTKDLFKSIDPVFVHSRAEAIDKVRSGEAAAAVIIPADVPSQIQSLVSQGVGAPTIELILNSRSPLERQFADQAIQSRVNDVQQAVSRQVLKVAVSDLEQVLNGGSINLIGQSFPLLGLRDSRTVIAKTIASLPRNSHLAPPLARVVHFADLAIDGLGFASPVLGSIGTPLKVKTIQLSGHSTPTASYAAVIAVVVSLMFVTLLLASGMLALERSENVYGRLVRGLVSPGGLLVEKIALAGSCAFVVTLVMVVGVSAFLHLEWSRIGLWLVALAVSAAAFAGLGVAIGALGRDVSTASLMAFMISLPIAFVSLVPANAVSDTVSSLLSAISFLFPFKAALDALNNALTGSSPGIGLPLLHLLALTAVFWALARVALRRFAR